MSSGDIDPFVAPNVVTGIEGSVIDTQTEDGKVTLVIRRRKRSGSRPAG